MALETFYLSMTSPNWLTSTVMPFKPRDGRQDN